MRARPRVRDRIRRTGPEATDVGSACEVLQAYAGRHAADSGFPHGLWLDGTLVGGLLDRVFDAATGVREIGCRLEPAANGPRPGHRGARVLIDWAFDERGMHRVEWSASSASTPSVNAARRLGMMREGVLRESFPRRGTRQDMEVRAVLAPEWRAARGARARAAHKDH